jgi:hypothetical protein
MGLLADACAEAPRQNYAFHAILATKAILQEVVLSMLMTGPYGRQWISPRASSAFCETLIDADECCAKGQIQKALSLYQSQAKANRIAQRRLNIAKKQLKKSRFLDYSNNARKEIALGLIDWYPGFESDVNIIIDLFLQAGLKPHLTAVEDSDILVAGSYGNRLVSEPALSDDKLVIFVTGENLCPSYDIHDFSISTRIRSFCGKNVRLPQWRSDILIDNDRISLKPCIQENQNASSGPRDLLVSAVYNNSTPEREELLYSLRQEFGVENIHIYGSHRTGHVDKFELLSRTVINVCLENSLGEGYVTEKLLHARAMGCKALYWGDSSFSGDFRTDGVLNIRDVGNLREVLEWCRFQLRTPGHRKQEWSYVDPAIFAKSPVSVCDVSKLAEWSSVVLAWRS